MRTVIKRMTALLTHAEEWSTWLAESSWFTFFYARVCNPPCSFKCDALEPFSHETLSVAVNNCYSIFCLSSKKVFLVYRVDGYLQWVAGQKYMIIVLVLEKSIMRWERPFMRPCLLFLRLLLCGAISPLRDIFQHPITRQTASGTKQNSKPSFLFQRQQA